MVLSLTGCAKFRAGPDYCGPPAACPTCDWTQLDNPRLLGQPANLCQWWSQFQDPVLEQLVCEVSAQNLTLRETGERILEARARLAVARGERWPQAQTFDGAYAKSRISSTTANFFNQPGIFTPDLNVENWSIGLQAAWELDFWGRFARSIEAAEANLGARIADYDDAKVLLIAETVRAYLDIQYFGRRIALAKQNAEIQESTYDLVLKKKEGGKGTGIDVAQSESNFRRTAALVPRLDTLQRQAAHRLCVLIGHPPCEAEMFLQCIHGTPVPPSTAAIGIPCDLLRQRPDVRRAERLLAAQAARIGVAAAEFYPHIGLNSNIGYASEDLSSLFQTSSSVGVISPNFSWNILNYCRIRNNVAAEKAAFRSLAYKYRATVLDALQEAEDAQIGFLNSHNEVEALTAAVKASQSAVEKAEKAYKEGATDYQRVFILQSELVELQDSLVAAEASVATSIVDLYKSLGGGWQTCCQQCPTCQASPASPACYEIAAPCQPTPPVESCGPEETTMMPEPAQVIVEQAPQTMHVSRPSRVIPAAPNLFTAPPSDRSPTSAQTFSAFQPPAR